MGRPWSICSSTRRSRAARASWRSRSRSNTSQESQYPGRSSLARPVASTSGAGSDACWWSTRSARTSSSRTSTRTSGPRWRCCPCAVTSRSSTRRSRHSVLRRLAAAWVSDVSGHSDPATRDRFGPIGSCRARYASTRSDVAGRTGSPGAPSSRNPPSSDSRSLGTGADRSPVSRPEGAVSPHTDALWVAMATRPLALSPPTGTLRPTTEGDQGSPRPRIVGATDFTPVRTETVRPATPRRHPARRAAVERIRGDQAGVR